MTHRRVLPQRGRGKALSEAEREPGRKIRAAGADSVRADPATMPLTRPATYALSLPLAERAARRAEFTAAPRAKTAPFSPDISVGVDDVLGHRRHSTAPHALSQ
ncbi:hypothetical protein [Streptomyces antimycoticus]|uniref:hypothetical protein n=2 Tax=Streptomyces antimycoticus TaxID=68175 RepID=UPI0036BFA563